mmetsp:Transcript_14890/g.26087  ORF Transcript_14890/g.26087 Transcript_14890/m.26087 type:complete len:256 (+) Transcript_14890:499-1266(+)
MDLAITKHYATQLVEGLAFLQMLQPSVIHHDLKPDNLVVDPRTQSLKFIDWGEMVYATAENGEQRPCEKMRTDVYAAPEGIGGHVCFQMPSHSFDIYAAGLIFLELLCPKIHWNQWTASGIEATDPESRISPVPVHQLAYDYCPPAAEETAEADYLISVIDSMLNPDPAWRPHPLAVRQQIWPAPISEPITFYNNDLVACFKGMKVHYESRTQGEMMNALVTRCGTTTLDLIQPSGAKLKDSAPMDRIRVANWDK